MTDQRQGTLIRQLQAALGGNSWTAGQFTTATLAAGNNSVAIDLPDPWPEEHVAFVAYPQPLTTADTIASHYGGVTGGVNLGQGFVRLTTTGASQKFLISWISVGR